VTSKPLTHTATSQASVGEHVQHCTLPSLGSASSSLSTVYCGQSHLIFIVIVCGLLRPASNHLRRRVYFTCSVVSSLLSTVYCRQHLTFIVAVHGLPWAASNLHHLLTSHCHGLLPLDPLLPVVYCRQHQGSNHHILPLGSLLLVISCGQTSPYLLLWWVSQHCSIKSYFLSDFLTTVMTPHPLSLLSYNEPFICRGYVQSNYVYDYNLISCTTGSLP
jgi:hypothetical protein